MLSTGTFGPSLEKMYKSPNFSALWLLFCLQIQIPPLIPNFECSIWIQVLILSFNLIRKRTIFLEKKKNQFLPRQILFLAYAAMPEIYISTPGWFSGRLLDHHPSLLRYLLNCHSQMLLLPSSMSLFSPPCPWGLSQYLAGWVALQSLLVCFLGADIPELIPHHERRSDSSPNMILH